VAVRFYSPTVSQPRRQSNAPPARRSKRHRKPMFTCLPDSSHVVPAKIAQDMTTIYKTGPMIVVSLPKLNVLRQNPLVGSAPPRANRARDKATQMVTSGWRYPGPHRGDPASSSFLSRSRPRGFHHTPTSRVGWHLAIRVLLIGTTRERCVNQLAPDLHRGAASTPVWPYGEVHLPMLAIIHLR
jgi:hypothetical protein